jgi:hypothetical protein
VSQAEAMARQRYSRDLAMDIAAEGMPDLLVGPANGALLPTKIVADTL